MTTRASFDGSNVAPPMLILAGMVPRLTKLTLWLLCWLIIAPSSLAQQVIPLDRDKIDNVLSSGVIVRAWSINGDENDPSLWEPRSLEQAQILAAEADHVTPAPPPSSAWVDGPLWLRITLTNPTDVDRIYRIVPDGWVSLFDVEAWLVRDGRASELIWRQPILGNSFDARLPRHRVSMSAPFVVAPGESSEIWLALQYGYRANAAYDLIEAQTFLASHEAEQNFHVFLFGARVALIAAIFVFAAILRMPIALYYGVYSVFIYVYFLANYGYTYAFLTKDLSLDYAVAVLSGGLGMSAFTLMTRAFLNAKERYPKFDRILLGTLGACWVIGLIAAFVTPPAWAQSVLLIAILASATANFWGATIAVANRHSGADLYLTACLFLFGLSIFGGVMITTSLIPVTLSRAALHVGFALDQILFALALVVRALGMRREHDRAINAELEALRDKAHLSDRLGNAEAAHGRALALAEHHRRRATATVHDLKQPLLSLRIALARKGGDETLARGLSYLESVIDRDLSDARRAIGGGGELGVDSFPLQKVIGAVVTMFSDEAQRKSIRLRAVETKLKVQVDPIILMRILTNLVANAVKHTDSGGILVGVRRNGADAVELQVIDTGAGLSASQLEQIFTAHVKSEESDGEGLGLSVVRALAEENGLTISVRSRIGRGSVFAIGGLKGGADIL